VASGEFDLIARYFRGLGACRDDVLLGVGDDAALVLPAPGEAVVLCVDTLVADVHFPLDAPAASVGHKVLAVNLSDLAAMGAQPAWALLSLTLPETNDAWLAEFARGFSALACDAGVALVGGDLTRGALCATVQVGGTVPPEQALRRDGARVGDAVYVTGTLGDAASGLALWQGGEPRRDADAVLIERLHRPTPRVNFGTALRGIATAAIDISDGLAADLGHILQASNVGASLDVDAVPQSAALQARFPAEQRLRWALAGGDDYELCVIAPPEQEAALEAAAQAENLRLTRIGVIEREPGLRLQRADGSVVTLERSGWQHF